MHVVIRPPLTSLMNNRSPSQVLSDTQLSSGAALIDADPINALMTHKTATRWRMIDDLHLSSVELL
jgi:hypothetical protein